jgi:hypothetical protein
MASVFFDLANDNAGLDHLDQVPHGSDNQCRMTPIRERMILCPSVAYALHGSDELAEPASAANQDHVAWSRISYVLSRRAAYVSTGALLPEGRKVGAG